MQIGRVMPVVMAMMLAGCGSFGAIGLSSPFNRAPPASPEPITPAPAAPVDTSNLPPVNAPPADENVPADTLPGGSDAGADTSASTGTTPPPATVPAGPAAAGGLSRTDLLGGWTITANGDTCQLFMTLTSWTGGYRASTRGCSSDLLKSVSAWNLDGRQVVLAGNAGAPLARLAAAGSSHFAGQLEGGSTPVSFYR